MINPGVATSQDLALTPASAHINGTVTDADNGFPISGATVRVGSSSTKTATNGTYTVPSLPAGQVEVAVTANHYQPQQALVQLTDHEIFSQDFQLSNLRHRPTE